MTASTTSPSGDGPVERASGPSLVDEAVRAVGGYYGRLGRIGLDLARTLLPIDRLRDAAARLPIEVSPTLGELATATGGRSVGRQTSAAAPPVEGATSRTSPTLLVEADDDRPGFGVFLVENLTADPVSGPIRVSAFTDERGHEVRPRLVLRPSTVSLGPGEHAMVKLAAELDEALEPGVRYRGEIAIPGLSDRSIPIVLRRRPPTDEPVGAEARAVAKPTARQRRRRPTSSPGESQ